MLCEGEGMRAKAIPIEPLGSMGLGDKAPCAAKKDTFEYAAKQEGAPNLHKLIPFWAIAHERTLPIFFFFPTV